MPGITFMDMAVWKRAEHCRLFRNALEPQYCVTFELDVSRFLPFVQERKYSFTLALIHAVAFCANEIEEFRYRFIDGRAALLDQVHTSFTWLNEETELFKFVRADMTENMEEFVRLAGEKARAQKAYFTGAPDEDVFIFSPMPWIAYTHVSHTVSGRKDNAIPLFDWGRYAVKDGKTLLPFSVQVHHSFVDGLHIGRLAERLQRFLDSPEQESCTQRPNACTTTPVSDAAACRNSDGTH